MSSLKRDQLCVTDLKIERIFTFNWTINNFSFLIDKQPKDKLPSTNFSIGSDEATWNLWLYPSGLSEKKDFLEFFLTCQEKEPSEFEGICLLSVLNNKGEQFVKNKQKLVPGTKQLNFLNFLKRDLLWNKANGLLPYDCLTIQCEFIKIGNVVTLPGDCEKKIKLESNPELQTSGLAKLFLNESLSDVKLIASCGKCLPAHKSVLISCSQIFEQMFLNDMLEKAENEVKINDAGFAALKEMLRFIYTGKVKKINLVAIELMQLADKYQINELRNLCEEELEVTISTDNVLDILSIAHYHNIKNLKSKALHFIKTHVQKIVNTKAFKSLKNDEVLKCVIETISQEISPPL